MRWLRTFAANRSGTAGAELALVLPFVLVLILATLEGGNYLYAEHKVAKGVRDGARYAARQPFATYLCPSSGTGAGTITDNAALTRIKNITRTGYASGANPVIGGWVDNDVTVTVDCIGGQGGLYTAVANSAAPRVRVNASVAYPALFNVAAINPSTIRLRAVAESAVMGI